MRQNADTEMMIVLVMMRAITFSNTLIRQLFRSKQITPFLQEEVLPQTSLCWIQAEGRGADGEEGGRPHLPQVSIIEETWWGPGPLWSWCGHSQWEAR